MQNIYPKFICKIFFWFINCLHGIEGDRFALQGNFGIITNAHTIFICVNRPNINFLLTERKLFARDRGSTARAQRGPYKNDRGSIFPSTARTS